MRREELIGRTIANRFRIKRVLGEGGMATVFVAEQDAEPREIALKILRPEMFADRTFAKRFEREAKAAARVQHPNSVVIYDAGVEGQLSYIAMELVRGDDLYTLLERHGALDPRAAATIVAEVCDALTVAHALGIVHRDLKPENIMIVRNPSASSDAYGPASVPLPAGSRVKVLDFGIAKLLDKTADAPQPVRSSGDRLDPPSANTAVTRAGTLIGTPAYMSPEQCALLPLDTRSDIYTCGVLLFQMIAGRLPFEGPTPLHIATKHIHEDPPPLRELLPQADASLETVILKALAKRPTERHPSARNLGAALRKLLPGLPDTPYAGARRTTGSVTVTASREPAPADSLSIDVVVDSTGSPAGIASAKTMVAEGLGGPPPSVLVHAREPPRRPLAVLARHPAPAPAAAPLPIADEPSHPSVDPEPDDLASTLVIGSPGTDANVARTRPDPALAGRQTTLQSAGAQTAAAPSPQRPAVDLPPGNPAATPLAATPLPPAPPAAVATKPAPAPAFPTPDGRRPAAPSVGAISASAPVPVSAPSAAQAMPVASVILSPALLNQPAPAAAPIAVSPGSAAAPIAPAPAPTFGIPLAPAAPLQAATPLARSLWIGILIGVAASIIVLAIGYALFASR